MAPAKMRTFYAKLEQHKAKLALTALMFVNHFAYGITLNILGASLVDLAYVYGVSLNGVSILPIASGVGYLGGSLSTYLYRFIGRDMLVNISVLIMAASIGLLPHYGSVPVAFAALLGQGFGSGAWDVAASVMLVELWPTNNGPHLQAAQFMYGAGSIVAPLLVAPYLAGDAGSAPAIGVSENVTSSSLIGGGFNQTTTETAISVVITPEQRVRSLTLPFVVCGVLQSVVPIIWMTLLWVKRDFFPKMDSSSSNNKKTSEKASEDVSSNSSSTRKMSSTSEKSEKYEESQEVDPRLSMPNRRCKLALCGFALATIISAELAHFNFSSALLQNLPNLTLSASTAATVMSLLSVTFTLGRVVTTLMAIWFSPDLILGYHYTLIALAIGGLYLGQSELWSILVATGVMGYGFCAQWSAWFSFTDRWLQLTESVCSFYSFLLGVVSLGVPLILAQTFEANPMVLLVLEAGLLVLSMSLFTSVRVWIGIDLKRSKRREEAARSVY